MQRALSRFSFSLEICTCFYKLQPRSLGVHGCGDKVHENSEGMAFGQAKSRARNSSWGHQTHHLDASLGPCVNRTVQRRHFQQVRSHLHGDMHVIPSPQSIGSARTDTGSGVFCALQQARSTNQGRGIARGGHLKIRFPCQEIRQQLPVRSVVVGRGKSRGSENLSVTSQC